MSSETDVKTPPVASLIDGALLESEIEATALDAEEMGKPISVGFCNATEAAGLMRFYAEAVDKASVFINSVAPLGEGAGFAFSHEPAGQSGIGTESGLRGMESYLRRQLVWFSHA